MKYFLILIFVFLSRMILANVNGTLQYTLNDSSNQNEIEVGKILEVELILYPIDSVANKINASEWTGKKIFNRFYVVNVEKVGTSENNADAYVIKMQLVLDDNDAEKIDWAIKINNELSADVINKLGKIPVKTTLKSSDKLYIANQSISSKANILFLVALIALIIISIATIIVVRLKKIQMRKQIRISEEKSRNEFFTIAKNAKDRLSHEDFILALNEQRFQSIVTEKNILLSQYLNTVKIIQFKEVWTDEELSEANNKIQEILTGVGK